MDSLQNLLVPSLEDILNKIQSSGLASPPKKSRKRSTPSDDPSQKKKRNRITFDLAQVDEMEKVFADNQYPDAISRDELATRIQLPEERVQIWFQNRRAKYRRELRHTYHPHEPPKEVEFPFLKKDTSTLTKSNQSHPEKSLPAQTGITGGTLELKKSQEPVSIVASSINVMGLSEEKTEKAASNEDSARLATTLDFLLSGAATNTNQSPIPPLKDDVENAVIVDNAQEENEQLSSEKANMLLWALSSLFSVQNE